MVREVIVKKEEVRSEVLRGRNRVLVLENKRNGLRATLELPNGNLYVGFVTYNPGEGWVPAGKEN